MIPNKIEALRIFKEQQSRLQEEQKIILRQGFQTGMWKIMKKQLEESLQSCRLELETCLDVERTRLLQGEIAALRILLDWDQVVSK